MLLLFQNQPPSEDKARKGKKKMSAKRKSQLQVVKEREDECFYCGDGGQIISCKKLGCPKVYHADCLNLSKRPAGENRGIQTIRKDLVLVSSFECVVLVTKIKTQ